MKKSNLKWTPTRSGKRADTFKAECLERGEGGFLPTYETKQKASIKFLLSNEYMRMWFKERDQYQKDTFSKKETPQDAELHRRFVTAIRSPFEKYKILPPSRPRGKGKKGKKSGQHFLSLVMDIEHNKNMKQSYKYKVDFCDKIYHHKHDEEDKPDTPRQDKKEKDECCKILDENQE